MTKNRQYNNVSSKYSKDAAYAWAGMEHMQAWSPHCVSNVHSADLHVHTEGLEYLTMTKVEVEQSRNWRWVYQSPLRQAHFECYRGQDYANVRERPKDTVWKYTWTRRVA